MSSSITIRERAFAPSENSLSIGIANIHAVVPGIEENKKKVLETMAVFKEKRVNMVVFPEFCLSGYFWDNQQECRNYMNSAVIERHHDWIMNMLFPMLDDDLNYIVFNNIRKAVIESIKYGCTHIRAFGDVDNQAGLRAIQALLKIKELFRNIVNIQNY